MLTGLNSGTAQNIQLGAGAILKTKYGVKSTSGFKKDLKKAYKQGKDIDKLNRIVKILANGE